MKYKIEICLPLKITSNLKTLIINRIAVTASPVIIAGTEFSRGEKTITELRMKSIIAFANHPP